ncbi:YfgM family protein [Simiduia agarivorans]|uniref:Ancillary SecYEG translocon subunit/Cell division coordinator CpoB TPR domain-containing protein n=1 Tax=Simiduia agarivorans (strain DSM 21679 / JCM 13881 / BCRC 17597 / SA1) TaxID=1117647 RepID=K4KGE5_SIMAS|nr:tetratricopeptide repeat protein [Simiduia agarivorans]AFU98144.1 hypothetical protein M5M_04685 [Simiduia agarivorans SA1 = DSM 21679]
MSAHLTEEEQLEALKRWWSENGKSLVIAVVLGVGGYVGYNGWQDSRQQNAEIASAKYEEITELLRQQEALTDENKSTLSHLAQELKQGHADTFYGVQAAMLLAKQAVEANDLATAESELRWAESKADTANVKQLVNLRLGRVLLAQDKRDDALAIAQQTVGPAFKALYIELKADALAAKGDTAAASEAYQAALDALTPEQAGLAAGLRMKLNSLQPVAAGSL